MSRRCNSTVVACSLLAAAALTTTTTTARAVYDSPTASAPPPQLVLTVPNAVTVYGSGQYQMQHQTLIRESPSLALPGGGGQYAISSFFDIFTELSTDSGISWTPVQSAFTGLDNSTINYNDLGSVGHFQTEMLQLDLQGGSLPLGMMIRESPTLQSTGQTLITPHVGGYQIDSFFDVFTELSVDGGATWMPAQAGTSFTGTPEPASAALLGIGVLGLLRRRRR